MARRHNWAGYDGLPLRACPGRSWCQLPYRAVSGWASEDKMDVCRIGGSELHDIASRDIAPSDESVLKPRLTDPQVRLVVSTVL